MAREAEEAVLRITARYVAEVEAGRRPRLSDYLERYPHYASAIADFIAYYHAVEVDMPEEIEAPGSQRIATESLPTSPLVAQPDDVLPKHEISTLLVTASEHYLTFPALARALDVSVDIVKLLERRMIEPDSIPSMVPRKLASLLQQSEEAIQTYLARPAQRDAARTQNRPRQKVAEGRSWYPAQELPGAGKHRFREVVESSISLSPEQRAAWHDLLEQEHLM